MDLGLALAEQQALSSSARRYRILHHFRSSSLLYLPADTLSSKMSDFCFDIDEDELGGLIYSAYKSGSVIVNARLYEFNIILTESLKQ